MVFKYYIRLAVTAIVLFFIITRMHVDVIGLIVGLSVVVISIIFTTVLELLKINSANEEVR